MLTRNICLLSIMMILFTSSFVPYSYSSVESEAQEDLLAGCRDGQTLVYRSAYLDYVCVDPSTAKRWIELGLAEIAQDAVNDDSDFTETIETNDLSDESQFPGAPPPPPKKSTMNTDSICREGQVLILQYSYNDTICTNASTALNWERIGLGEIVLNEVAIEKTEPNIDVPLETENDLNLDDSEEQNSGPISKCDSYETTNSTISPTFRLIGDHMWLVTGDDITNSLFIEGEDGLIIINTLNCYDVAKNALDQFRSISEKLVKIIIFTTVNPELLDGSRAFLEEGDGGVEFIVHDNLVSSFDDDSDLDVQNIISFASRFSLDISGVEMTLIHVPGESSDQMYISLPQSDGLLIADENDSLYPVLINTTFLP